MARYRGPVCRLCRREGMKLFLKGERCYTDKCAFERRAYPPGAHGQGRRKRSDYGEQLRDALTGFGHAVEWHRYPMAHAVCAEEIAAIREYLLRAFAPAIATA